MRWQTLVPFGLIIGIFSCGLGALALNIVSLESQIVQSITLNDAQTYAKAIKEFRTLYTSEVVERVRPHGIGVTHDYTNHPASIPLPATLSLLLGNRLGSTSEGAVRLYSRYPFPWRTAQGGPKDAFERDALDLLEVNPDRPFYQFETVNGKPVLRFAISDRMRKGCVDCHNTHPDSPKKDWKVGDLRGVLSVTRPLDEATVAARESLSLTVGFLMIFSVFGVLIIGFAGARHHRNAVLAAESAQETARINVSLQGEIVGRERAETERRALEDQFRHTQKLETVGLLAGGIAHDFNNLLQSLIGNIELAQMKADSESSVGPHLEQVLDLAQRASGLTNQLLTYSGRVPSRKEQLDLSALIADMEALLKTVGGGSGELTYELAQDLKAVNADNTQIQQVVLNLVTNAIEASASSAPTVSVSTRMVDLSKTELERSILGLDLPAGAYVELEVKNRGETLSQETIARMFEPFFTTKRTGRGLGLAVVHGIVKTHRGAIRVEHEEAGWTRIRLYLPASSAVVRARQGAKEMAQSIELSSTILVVDDEQALLDVVCDLLRSHGANVLAASSGGDAIELYQAQADRIDLVVLDLRLPDSSGVEVYHRMHQMNPDVRVILSSGYAADSEIAGLLESGAVQFLQKPYRLFMLLNMTHQILASSADES